MTVLFTLDFEASCLPRHGKSFPIEVGIAGAGGFVRAWLIRPEPDWRDWTWTQEAEGLHGVSRAQLMRDGLPATQVLAELADALAGQPAYADSYLDAGWMRTLEAALGAPPIITVRHIDALIDQLRLDPAAAARAIAAMGGPDRPRHRAGADAAWLQDFAAQLQAQADARLRAPLSIAA